MEIKPIRNYKLPEYAAKIAAVVAAASVLSGCNTPPSPEGIIPVPEYKEASVTESAVTDSNTDTTTENETAVIELDGDIAVEEYEYEEQLDGDTAVEEYEYEEQLAGDVAVEEYEYEEQLAGTGVVYEEQYASTERLHNSFGTLNEAFNEAGMSISETDEGDDNNRVVLTLNGNEIQPFPAYIINGASSYAIFAYDSSVASYQSFCGDLESDKETEKFCGDGICGYVKKTDAVTAVYVDMNDIITLSQKQAEVIADIVKNGGVS